MLEGGVRVVELIRLVVNLGALVTSLLGAAAVIYGFVALGISMKGAK